jgi:ketosteroid isomerase-like protein
MLRRGLTIIAAAWLLAQLAVTPAVGQDARAPDHAALRALRDTVARAIGARDFAALSSVLHKEFVLITVDQQKFKSLPELKAYWEGLFSGSRAPLRSITLQPESDDLTRFLADDVGIAHGTSADTYELAGGDRRVMRVRWTGVVQKVDGQWKLVSAHVGTSLFDNPVLEAAKRRAMWTAAGALAAGLAIGGVAGVVGGRRRATAR